MSDPVYSTYPPVIGATGATPVYVQLKPELNFHPDLDEVAAAITPRTRAILFNTPHNPTGAVLRPDHVLPPEQRGSARPRLRPPLNARPAYRAR